MNGDDTMDTTPIRRCLAAAATVLARAGMATSVAAQDAGALRRQALAATCAACHGSDGHAVPQSAIPGLAGLPAGYLVEQMKAFRDGSRSATVMNQLAKGYSDAQVEQLAAFFAAQKP